VGPCPAESAAGPMEKMSHRSDSQTWRRTAERLVGFCCLLCQARAEPISIASVCNPTIIDSSLYEPTFKLDFQCLKPPALSCAARFNLPTLDQAAMMDEHRFRGAPAMSWFLSPSYKVNLSEDREISDSDDNSLPCVREIIDLTANDDDGGGDNDEEDIIEVSGLRNRLKDRLNTL
jgi:hypothetical protein